MDRHLTARLTIEASRFGSQNLSGEQRQEALIHWSHCFLSGGGRGGGKGGGGLLRGGGQGRGIRGGGQLHNPLGLCTA